MPGSMRWLCSSLGHASALRPCFIRSSAASKSASAAALSAALGSARAGRPRRINAAHRPRPTQCAMLR